MLASVESAARTGAIEPRLSTSPSADPERESGIGAAAETAKSDREERAAEAKLSEYQKQALRDAIAYITDLLDNKRNQDEPVAAQLSQRTDEPDAVAKSEDPKDSKSSSDEARNDRDEPVKPKKAVYVRTPLILLGHSGVLSWLPHRTVMNVYGEVMKLVNE